MTLSLKNFNKVVNGYHIETCPKCTVEQVNSVGPDQTSHLHCLPRQVLGSLQVLINGLVVSIEGSNMIFHTLTLARS